MTVLAFSNLDFGRSWRAHRKDIRRIAKKAHAIGLCELRRPLWLALREVLRIFQPNRPHAPGSEAIVVPRKSPVKIIRRGSERAFESKHGQEIGPRNIPWALLHTPDAGNIVFIDNHRPPKRMQHTGIDEENDRTLRRIIDGAVAKGFEWVVVMDANDVERDDPARLHETYGAKWVGNRIDLAAVSKGLEVEGWWEELDPDRKDRHPVLFVNVKRTKEN